MPASPTIIEPFALTPAGTAPCSSVSKRSPEGKIEARKHGPGILFARCFAETYYAGLPIMFGCRVHALPHTPARPRD
jgi:hypothetical protein